MFLAPEIVFGHLRAKYGFPHESVASNDAETATSHNRAVQTIEQLATVERKGSIKRVSLRQPSTIKKRGSVSAVRLCMPPNLYLSSKFDGSTRQVIIDDSALDLQPAGANSAGNRADIELLTVGSQDEVQDAVQNILQGRGVTQTHDYGVPRDEEPDAAAPRAIVEASENQAPVQANVPVQSDSCSDQLTMKILGNLNDTEPVDDSKLNQLVEESHTLDAANRPDFSSLMSGFRDKLALCDRESRMLNDDLHDLRALLGYCDILSNLDEQSSAAAGGPIDSESLRTMREVEKHIDELQNEAEMRKRRVEIAGRMKQREAEKHQRETLLRKEKLTRLVRGEPTADSVDVRKTFNVTIRRAERVAERHRVENETRVLKRDEVNKALQVKALLFADELLDETDVPVPVRSRSTLARSGKTESPLRPAQLTQKV